MQHRAATNKHRQMGEEHIELDINQFKTQGKGQKTRGKVPCRAASFKPSPTRGVSKVAGVIPAASRAGEARAS